MALKWGSQTLGAEPTTNLLVHLDASNSSSYAGSGTTWNDISGNGRNFTLVNAPTYTLAGELGYFTFNGTSQYAFSAAALDLTSYNSITIEVSFNMTNTNVSMVFEHTIDWNTQTGGLGLVTHDNGAVNQPHLYHTNHNSYGPRNYYYNSLSAWRVHTNIWSDVVDSTGRNAFVNGQELPFDTSNVGYTSEKSTTAAASFANAVMYLAARAGSSLFFAGSISTFKVYGQKYGGNKPALMFLNKKTRLGL
jgi:hypothetical protein